MASFTSLYAYSMAGVWDRKTALPWRTLPLTGEGIVGLHVMLETRCPEGANKM
jgi:hypothetical protein